jgi:coenzyme F420-reducing hydrogenase alpha subunit
MAPQIVIDPVTRIEGHAKITLHLDDAGEVRDAHFHVTQFRGFEKLCEGRPFTEMPALMARICGICPVSHLLASAKACDALLAVQVPPAAVRLRRVLNLAQIVQSHALSFFHLSAPDLLLGMDAEPGQRSLFGLLASQPEVARDGIRLRRFGQQIIEAIGGKRIHPAGVVAGGMSHWPSPSAHSPACGMCSIASKTRSPALLPSRRSSSAWSARPASRNTTTAGCASSERTVRSLPTVSTRRATRSTSARRWSRGPT